jgi:hypothetical protein
VNRDGGGNSSSVQELWDATIRLLRLLANICIDERIGTTVATQSVDGLQVLTDLLVCMKASSALVTPPYSNSSLSPTGGPGNALPASSSSAVSPISGEANEELLLNIVAACTNVTFYACQPHLLTPMSFGSGSVSQQLYSTRMQSLLDMARHLSTCLFHDNEEIVLETARALGLLLIVEIELLSFWRDVYRQSNSIQRCR